MASPRFITPLACLHASDIWKFGPLSNTIVWLGYRDDWLKAVKYFWRVWSHGSTYKGWTQITTYRVKYLYTHPGSICCCYWRSAPKLCAVIPHTGWLQCACNSSQCQHFPRELMYTCATQWSSFATEFSRRFCAQNWRKLRSGNCGQETRDVTVVSFQIHIANCCAHGIGTRRQYYKYVHARVFPGVLNLQKRRRHGIAFSSFHPRRDNRNRLVQQYTIARRK